MSIILSQIRSTIRLNCKKKIDTLWNASHFSWAKRVGCTSDFVRPWVVVGDVYGRHSGNQCAAGAGWLDRYYDYGCFVEIQKKKPPELEDEFPFGIGVMNKRLCVTMSSVAGNFNFLMNCEAPRTVCGWEKCGLSTSQLAAIVCKLLCFCVSVRESRWKRRVVVSATNHQPFTRLSVSTFPDRSASKRYPGTWNNPVT